MKEDAFSGERISAAVLALPEGKPRLDALQDAIVQADRAADAYWRLRFRADYICDAVYYDDEAKILPCCGEFFALLEEHPGVLGEPLEELSCFLAAKRAAALCQVLPQIPLAVCEGFFDRLEELTRRYRKGSRLYHNLACEFYLGCGLDRAAVHFEAFRKAKLDMQSKCRACEQNFMVRYALAAGDWSLAERSARPIFDGSLTCHDVPWDTFHIYTEAYLDRCELKKAAPLARQLARGGIRDVSDTEYAGTLLRFYGMRGDAGAGGALLERCLSWPLGLWDRARQFYFYQGAWVLCAAMEREEEISLRLPRQFPLWQESGRYRRGALADWFYGQAADIAGQFDRRGGGTVYGDTLGRAARAAKEMDR